MLCGGTAAALQGANRIFSDDIVNREVKRADLDKGAVTSKKIGKRQVRKGDVARNSITSGKVRPDTLTGDDILEGTLSGMGLGILGGTMQDITGQDSEQRPPIGFSDAPVPLETLGPIAPQPFVAQDLTVVSAQAIPEGESLEITMTIGDATGLSCTIQGGDNLCDSGTATGQIGIGVPYTFLLSPSSPALAGLDLSFGWRAVSP